MSSNSNNNNNNTPPIVIPDDDDDDDDDDDERHGQPLPLNRQNSISDYIHHSRNAALNDGQNDYFPPHFLPSVPEDDELPDYVSRYGMAFHVHNIFHEMFGNKEEEVKEKTKQLITKLMNNNKTIVIEKKTISTILNDSFSSFIKEESKLKEKEQDDLLHKLKQITDKLTQCSFEKLKEDEEKLLQVAIKYVVLQDKEFAINYIIFYLKDVTEAYDEGENSMSCVGGIHERIILMLITQMGLYIVSGDDKKKIEEYKDILSIFILPKNDTNKILATLNEEMDKAVDKKDILEQKFSSDEMDLLLINDFSKKDSYERKQSFIKQVNRIKVTLQISGQISESNMNDMYDTFNQTFILGGKKKKTRKNNKKYKINKSKKIKHKFIRKTRKRNVKKVQIKKQTQMKKQTQIKKQTQMKSKRK